MNDQFDELTKGLAQSVNRRGALKKFGAGLAGLALAAVGLPNAAKAAGNTCKEWRCTDGWGGGWFTLYACSGSKPHGLKCHSFGTVPCGYCTNCC